MLQQNFGTEFDFGPPTWIIIVFPLIFATVFFLIVGTVIVHIVKNLKDAGGPITTATGTIISKRTHVSRSGQSAFTKYFATAELTDGTRQEYTVDGKVYGIIKEGDAGTLVIRGNRLLNIDRVNSIQQQPNGAYCAFCGSFKTDDSVRCESCGANRKRQQQQQKNQNGW